MVGATRKLQPQLHLCRQSVWASPNRHRKTEASRTIAFRLALLVLAVFAARTLPDKRPAIDTTVTASIDDGSLHSDQGSALMRDMALRD